jgi:hypothetical protein
MCGLFIQLYQISKCVALACHARVPIFENKMVVWDEIVIKLFRFDHCFQSLSDFAKKRQ